MSTLVGELRKIILKALPSNDENITQHLIDRILDSGLESTDDLKFVQQEDISDILPTIKLRKLLNAFKMETETVTLDLTIMQHTPSLSAGSSSPPQCSSNMLSVFTDGESSSLEDNMPSTSHVKKSWFDTFQLMPGEIQSAISTGKRPSPQARRQMVRVLADEIRKFEPTPTRAQCLSICKAIVRQYPQTFADQLHDGRIVGEGYSSLLAQIKTRIENLSRTASFRQHRSSGSGVKRGPTDTYGCTRFQPDLPLEETDSSVENKRQKLENIYLREGAKGAEKAETCVTFVCGAKDIVMENYVCPYKANAWGASSSKGYKGTIKMSATPADLEKAGNLPVTPRLILLVPGGSSMHTGIPSKPLQAEHR
ncbi:hypothetical protein cypCar_00010926 [Cyprinus carpio]|nr:hypothetical protein cypCar_00010926 [Cyprinus carpio]